MVQEVQTWVGITNETTLETIEAIGTSSFKIIEGRQTKGEHYVSGCIADGNVKYTYHEGEERDSGEVMSTDTAILESLGKREFSIRNWGIRVPAAGTYSIQLTWGGGASTSNATIILKGGWKTLYTKTFTSSNSETVNLTADLGKFDLIEIRGQFYYKGSASVASMTFSTKPTLTIQQL